MYHVSHARYHLGIPGKGSHPPAQSCKATTLICRPRALTRFVGERQHEADIGRMYCTVVQNESKRIKSNSCNHEQQLQGKDPGERFKVFTGPHSQVPVCSKTDKNEAALWPPRPRGQPARQLTLSRHPRRRHKLRYATVLNGSPLQLSLWRVLVCGRLGDVNVAMCSRSNG